MTIGEKIKEYREARGLTQTDLARRIGISRSYLCEIEANTSRTVSGPVLYRAARELGVTMESLLDEPELFSSKKSANNYSIWRDRVDTLEIENKELRGRLTRIANAAKGE